MRFKKGDKVWVQLQKKCGVVMHNPTELNGDYVYRINFQDGSPFYWTKEKGLTSPRVADTKITRKLYKGKIKRIEKGWIYLK